MNKDKLQELLSDLDRLDREIEAMEAALVDDRGTTFAVVGGNKMKRLARVEITKEMAEPFLRIGLRSLQRQRSDVERQVREL